MCFFLILKVVSEDDFFKMEVTERVHKHQDISRTKYLNTTAPEVIIACANALSTSEIVSKLNMIQL